MTEQDVDTVLEVLFGAFGRTVRGGMRNVWRDEIIDLHADAAAAAAQSFARSGAKLPSLPEFRREVLRQENQTVDEPSRSVCKTCGGDRIVIVARRKPQASLWMKERGIEPHPEDLYDETAPCPDCNPLQVEYRRQDGSMFRGMDPATAKMRLGE